MSFEQDMRRFQQKAEGASEEAIRATALQLFGGVIERTPVDTGRARGNWQTAVNTPASGTVERTGASVALSEVNLAAARFTLADTIYLANNLPYIERLERGSSQQAPAGMVEVTIDSFQTAIEANARKHRI